MTTALTVLWTVAGCVLLALLILQRVRRRLRQPSCQERTEYKGAKGVRYIVERVNPAHGLVGMHSAPFTDDDLGRLYGQGQYIVRMQIPGRHDLERTVSVSTRPSHETLGKVK